MITFNNVGFDYKRGAGATIHDVSLELTKGGFYFLTGPSGAGKTTFVKLCYLEHFPTSGMMSVMGQSANDLSRDDLSDYRRRIGIVHQDCRFLDHLSVADNIALPLIVSGEDPRKFRENLIELLNWVNLSDLADHLPRELSGGERQRVALARAIINSPDFIIADEPTGNVDWEMGQQLLHLLIELNRMGKTILIATHDLQLIRSVKSKAQMRVLRLEDGYIRQAGSDL